MKRLYVFLLFSFLCVLTYAQQYEEQAIVYYEGLSMYPIEYYSYEFQSLLDTRVQPNPLFVTNDSSFIAFLKRKIASVERCTKKGECLNATLKPNAMIQVVLLEDDYCYYTVNISSYGIYRVLTIDGKSYVPDEELQDVIVEIVKYCEKNKGQIPTAKLHAIIKGERDNSNPYWPLLLPH